MHDDWSEGTRRRRKVQEETEDEVMSGQIKRRTSEVIDQMIVR